MGQFTVGNWGGRIIDGGDGGNCNGFWWHCQWGQGGVWDVTFFIFLSWHMLWWWSCAQWGWWDNATCQHSAGCTTREGTSSAGGISSLTFRARFSFRDSMKFAHVCCWQCQLLESELAVTVVPFPSLLLQRRPNVLVISNLMIESGTTFFFK